MTQTIIQFSLIQSSSSSSLFADAEIGGVGGGVRRTGIAGAAKVGGERRLNGGELLSTLMELRALGGGNSGNGQHQSKIRVTRLAKTLKAP